MNLSSMYRMLSRLYCVVKWQLAFSLLLLNISCLDFNPLGYTRVEPKREDLVGTWVPDRDSLTYMKESGKYDIATPVQLILRADGSFEMINMPDWWGNVHGTSYGSFYSFSGTWKPFFPPQATAWRLLLISSNNSRPVDLFGQSPPYQLFFAVGNPDSNKGMTFVKKS